MGDRDCSYPSSATQKGIEPLPQGTEQGPFCTHLSSTTLSCHWKHQEPTCVFSSHPYQWHSKRWQSKQGTGQGEAWQPILGLGG